MTFTGTVLALDLATTTGWAHGTPGNAPKCGHIRFARGGSRASAYRAFRYWLDRVTTPDMIVFESPALPMVMHGRTNIDTIKLLIGFAEHLEEWCHERVELREASVGQVRSHFIGKNMKSAIAKPMTVARCRELGWPCETSDEADACALWDYQCRFLRPDLASKTAPIFSRALIR
jgi:hypothetical protein